MNYQLYLIINKVNNKKYIGQTKETTGFEKRFLNHIRSSVKGSKHCLHLAMKKYGKDNFEVKLLLKTFRKKL